MVEATIVEIVEHDEGAAHLAERVVRSLGYQPAVFLSEIQFLKAHERARPGCVLLDYAMPILSGLQVQALLAASGSIRPIIFASGMGTIPVTVAALRSGAVDFVTKPFTIECIEAAIRTALETYARLRHTLEQQRQFTEKIGSLTHRELQVLERVVAGRLNKQIAAELGTVEKTIKVHRARVMEKLGVRTLPGLVDFANAAGIRATFGRGLSEAADAPGAAQSTNVSLGSNSIGTREWDIHEDRVVADKVSRDQCGLSVSNGEQPSLAAYLHALCEPDKQKMGRVIREAMATGEEFQFTYRVRGRSGVRTVFACGRVLFDSAGLARRLAVAQVEMPLQGFVDPDAINDIRDGSFSSLFTEESGRRC